MISGIKRTIKRAAQNCFNGVKAISSITETAVVINHCYIKVQQVKYLQFPLWTKSAPVVRKSHTAVKTVKPQSRAAIYVSVNKDRLCSMAACVNTGGNCCRQIACYSLRKHKGTPEGKTSPIFN